MDVSVPDMDKQTESVEIDPRAWISAINQALDAIARDTLCVGGAIIKEEGELGAGSGVRGSYISLVDGEVSALIGIRGTMEDCQKLTRYMMAMDEDEPLEDEDVTGVIGEIANIMAGVVKSKIGEADLRLGIPMVVSGRVTPANQQQTACRFVGLGEAQLEVLLLHRRKNRAARRMRHAS